MVRRCLTCGRRWLGAEPPCGHPPDTEATSAHNTGSTPALPPLESLPGYTLGEVLGQGGFSVVYEAIRDHDGQHVAIKVFNRSSAAAQERARLEAEALRAVGPPFVPRLHDVGTLEDGSPYLVCEHVDLQPLSVQLAAWSASMPWKTVVPLADAVLSSLEATHRQGFIHLDLKPENILVSEAPPEARLIDFGIALRTEPGTETATRSSSGIAFGTPDYMAPEQCESHPMIDYRADIYAIGVVLYEMMTGRPPFFGSASEVREAHVGRRPLAPSRVADVPPAMDEILLRCLAKDPSRRWGSVGELRRALRRIGGSAPAPGPAPASASPRTPAAAVGQDAPAPPAPPPADPRADNANDSSAAASRTTGSQRLPVGLLCFEATVTTGRIQQALTALGGQLMNVSGSRCVAIFGILASGNPVQRAYDSARALIAQSLIERALVDRDRVRVRRRPDGSQRLFSAAFLSQERYPQPGDPAGVLLTQEAAYALPDVRTTPVRDGILRVLQREDDDGNAGEATIFQIGATRLIGRAQQRRELVDSARKATDDARPTIATVLSEPGFGKSHLSAAVLTELRDIIPGVEIIHLRAREPLGGESQDTLRSLLRTTLRLPVDAPADHGHALLLDRLGREVGAEVWPAAAMIMGWLPTDATAVRRLSAAPAALRSAATRAAGEALRRLAREHPVCCTIDDAHFADDTTLDALEYATLSEAAVPLWVCVLARQGFERARPAWARRAARTLTLRLPPLDRDSAREMCRMLLHPAENISRATLTRIVQQTQGNPLLLVELARGIKQHGLIRRHARGDAWYLASDELDKLPDLPRVEWLAERELAALPPELAAHARLVSHLGSDFSIPELEGVLGELEAAGAGASFPLDASVGVQRLLTHGLLVTHRDGHYGFRNPLIREQVVRATPDHIRRRIHEACFRFYQQARSVPAAQRMPRLAQHAAASGAHVIASDIYLSLAEQAAGRHTYVEAESMYTRALGLLPEDDRERRMRAFSGRGSMRYRLSRFEDALEDLGRARDIAHGLGDLAAETDLLLDMATVLDWSQDFHTSRTLVEEAQALAPPTRSALLDTRLCMGLGRVAWRQRQWSTARPLLEQAIAQAERLGDAGYESLVISLLMLGDLAVAEKRIDLAETTLDRAIALCEERGDKLHLAGALNNRRDIWISRKNVERTAADLLRVQQIGREIGLAEYEYISAYNLAELYYFAGDLEAAWPHMRRAVEIEPSNSAKPLSLLLQARLLAFADRRTSARSVLESIRESQDRSRSMGHADALFLASEEVLCTMAELATRERISAEWDELRARAEQVSQPEELAEVIEMMGLVALRRGRVAQAKQLLEEALAVCARAPHLVEERIRRQLASLR